MTVHEHSLALPVQPSEDGASAVEYGLLVAGIAGLVVAVVFALGGTVSGTFGGSCEKVKTATEPSSRSSCT